MLNQSIWTCGSGGAPTLPRTTQNSSAARSMGCRTIFSWAKTVETKRIAYKENVCRQKKRAPTCAVKHVFGGAQIPRRTILAKICTPAHFLGEAFARLVHFCTSAHILGRFLAGVARNRATGKRTPSNRARYTGNHDFSKSRAPRHRCTQKLWPDKTCAETWGGSILHIDQPAH